MKTILEMCKDEIIEDREAGMTTIEMAKKYKVSTDLILAYLRRAGVTLRPKGLKGEREKRRKWEGSGKLQKICWNCGHLITLRLSEKELLSIAKINRYLYLHKKDKCPKCGKASELY